MRIDYDKNPLGIIRRFTIPYGKTPLEARIRGVIEEGFSDVTWFEGEIKYKDSSHPAGLIELGYPHKNDRFDLIKLYSSLKKGSSNLSKVERILKNWVILQGLEISEVTDCEALMVA